MESGSTSLDIISNAVEVRGVYRGYGRGRNKITVLRDLDMTVQTGTIYGLLGPSGCGKTTLLRCILGRLKVNRGQVRTLGKEPGTVGHGVPGKRVGYMPQELALFNMFTIGETMSYFGRVYEMKSSKVKQRIQFLIDLLSLPDKSRIIECCSGGQQRRTSFAVALLQEPELLVLDEPTVGVDPLLRHKIWEHLLKISSTHVTIIITTHYVEEARQAHRVGLMRNGYLLAEAPPSELLETYQLQSLEDVFLHLCEEDSHDQNGEASTQNVVPTQTKRRVSGPSTEAERQPLFEDDMTTTNIKTNQRKSECASICNWFPKPHNVLAQTIKNFITLRRNIGFLLFEFLLPAIQITLFCICIGGEPYNLPLAVVNNETCSGLDFCGSQVFLHHLDNRTFHLLNYSYNYQGALDKVKQGEAWGLVNIGENFTTDFKQRMSPVVKNDTLEGSTIHVRLDMTNQQITMTIQSKTLAAFQAFTNDLLNHMHLNPAIAQIPLKIDEPVYGELNPKFTNFMAPGIILSITYFMATGLTALAFVLERKQGLLDRSIVAGVNTVEIMIGHILAQFVVMVVQVGLLLTVALAAFKVPYQGSLILVILLPLLQGLTGMTLGLLISAICEEETAAIQCALGMVYPNLLLSGIIWPLESMPQWLKVISYCLPVTYAAEAMRSVLSRGWDLTYKAVWSGYVMTIGWGIGMLILSIVILKVKAK